MPGTKVRQQENKRQEKLFLPECCSFKKLEDDEILIFSLFAA
jgi:hypothetical protein